MPKEKLFEIAAEPAHVCQERAKAEAQARALEDVIRICRPHALRGPGMSQNLIVSKVIGR